MFDPNNPFSWPDPVSPPPVSQLPTSVAPPPVWGPPWGPSGSAATFGSSANLPATGVSDIPIIPRPPSSPVVPPPPSSGSIDWTKPPPSGVLPPPRPPNYPPYEGPPIVGPNDPNFNPTAPPPRPPRNPLAPDPSVPGYIPESPGSWGPTDVPPKRPTSTPGVPPRGDFPSIPRRPPPGGFPGAGGTDDTVDLIPRPPAPQPPARPIPRPPSSRPGGPIATEPGRGPKIGQIIEGGFWSGLIAGGIYYFGGEYDANTCQSHKNDLGTAAANVWSAGLDASGRATGMKRELDGWRNSPGVSPQCAMDLDALGMELQALLDGIRRANKALDGLTSSIQNADCHDLMPTSGEVRDPRGDQYNSDVDSYLRDMTNYIAAAQRQLDALEEAIAQALENCGLKKRTRKLRRARRSYSPPIGGL